MIYDILYLFNQFIEDLPDTYLEFISRVTTIFVTTRLVAPNVP